MDHESHPERWRAVFEKLGDMETPMEARCLDLV